METVHHSPLSKAKRYIAHRIHSRWSGEELWRQLQVFIRDAGSQKCEDEFLRLKISQLVETLVKNYSDTYAYSIASLFCELYPKDFVFEKCSVCHSSSLVPKISGYKPLPHRLYDQFPLLPFYSRGCFPLVYCECTQCGNARIQPTPSRSWIDTTETPSNTTVSLENWKEDPEYVQAKRMSLDIHYQKLGFSAYLKDENSAVLDISCGSGVGLELFRDRFGWKNLRGIEIDPLAVLAAQKLRNLDVRTGVITQTDLSSWKNSFDLVTLDNALEHHSDPKDALTRIYPLLKPEGGLFVIVPNYHGYAVENLGLAYHNLFWGHWHYFTVQSLSQLARECGFELITAYSGVCEPQVYKMVVVEQNLLEREATGEEVSKMSPFQKEFRGDFIHLFFRKI